MFGILKEQLLNLDYLKRYGQNTRASQNMVPEKNVENNSHNFV